MTTQAGQAVVSPPKPRAPRAARIGVVTTASRQKTIRVTVQFSVKHSKYGKYTRRRTHYHAHDEKSEARVGDMVEIVECRPLSRTKHHRLVRILARGHQAPQAQGGAT
ncbi:MAG: 30S ribosomal protein S17 [Phycisphaerae bacterium]